MSNLLKNLTLLAVFLGLSLAAADWFLGRIVLTPQFFEAMRQDIDWDRRTRLDVLLDARQSDPNWYPALPGNTFLEDPLLLGDERVIPLGGVADTHAVGCNENGFYSILKTDEAGFRNPAGTWPLTDHKYIFLVGDSFAAGACVKDGEHVADRLRSYYPHVVNLGVGGNGPLFELAGIVEYVSPEKTNFVFWMYYEGNDLKDLARDRNSPILMQYLDPEFSQDLFSKQDLINAAVRTYTEARIGKKSEGRAMILPNLRGLLWNYRNRESAIQQDADEPDSKIDLQLLQTALERARHETEQRGGKFVFVHLPEYFRFSPEPLRTWAKYSDDVKSMVRSLGIPIIDIEDAFMTHPDPIELFPFRFHGHYTPEGYALVSQAIIAYLSEQENPNP